MTAAPEFGDPRSFAWDEIDNPDLFGTHAWTDRILLGLDVHTPGTVDEDPGRVESVRALLEEHSGKAIAKLRALEDLLKEMFIEKEEIIEMVIVSAIAHQPLLLVGKPGTAKSKIILKFCEGLGLKKTVDGRRQVFQYLLNGFTEPDEILGPVMIQLLQQDPPRFERLRDGSITDAEVLFLDEVFRGNSAILNALLSVINERQVYEGGITHRARARLIFGASNATPSPRQLEDLRAFYERFIIRLESSCVPVEYDPKGGGAPPARQALAAQGWANEVSELRAGYRPEGSELRPVACLNHVLLLNRAIAELWGGRSLDSHADFMAEYHKLVHLLAGGEDPVVEIDDRKFVRLLAVLRAHSLYTRVDQPRRSDLTVLRHIWNDIDRKRDLQDVVDNFLGLNVARRSINEPALAAK